MSTLAVGLAKCDAAVRQALTEHRAGLLRIMVRLTEGDGAESRVRQVLTRRNRSIDKRLMDGRLVVATVETDDLLDLVASDDVERVSLDAVVSAGISGT